MKWAIAWDYFTLSWDSTPIQAIPLNRLPARKLLGHVDLLNLVPAVEITFVTRIIMATPTSRPRLTVRLAIYQTI